MKYTSTTKAITFFLLISTSFVACEKSITIAEQENEAALSVSGKKAEKFKELGREFLTLAKNPEFKQLIYDQCKIQKFGDYYVRIGDLLNNPNANKYFTASALKTTSKLITDLKNLGARTPILFYPSVETKEAEKTRTNNVRVSLGTNDLNGTTFMVIDDRQLDPNGTPYNGFLNDQYPGYIFNTNGLLEYSQQVNEEFAWENDVWVIGEEENCSDENMVSAPEDDGNPNGRFQGQAENAGLIQVTDLGAIESWISGKLEFKMTVMNSSGAIISGPLAFGKWKRSNFQDQKWKDFGIFVGNWHTSTFGNWMYEHWMEEDGGNSNSITITMPPPSGTTGPTFSTTIPSKNQDDNLGLATIQFTDLITQVYNISYARIKRRN